MTPARDRRDRSPAERPAAVRARAQLVDERRAPVPPRSGHGSATAVGPAFGTLAGSNFDIDFNPVSDRVRVVSDADTNLRLNPDTGELTATDGSLAFAPGDPNFGVNPAVSAAAYTNAFPGATGTTLYDVDLDLRVLTSQSPPNGGTLNTVGVTGLPASTLRIAGLDIGFPSGIPYLSTTSAGAASSLRTLILTTGAVTAAAQIGPISAARYPFIAVEPAEAAYSANDVVVAESAGTATVTVTRSTRFVAASVPYTTLDGTATAGSDYTATSGTLSFAVGEDTKTISIPITNDSVDEGTSNETVRIQVGPTSSGRVYDLGAHVAIVDDDAPKPVPPTPAPVQPPTPEDAPPTVAFTSPPAAALPSWLRPSLRRQPRTTVAWPASTSWTARG